MDGILEKVKMLFKNVYSGRRVLVTGDSGFKGSYLAMWLTRMGAQVLGVSLPMPPGPAHSRVLSPVLHRTVECDIRNREELTGVVKNFRPEVVFHLAAQPLVRLSYRECAATFDTNVTGTINILEAIRQTPQVRAAVMITSDKCYENREDGVPCVESDPMGGFDPYSASKGCAELVISSYRRSFFSDTRTLLASARAGNVIGGGDWAADRLIPDLMRGAAAGEEAVLRNPQAVRPWQHVFEPLSGYLLLGQELLMGNREAASGWNFGPDENASITVENVVKIMQQYWDKLRYRVECDAAAPHEAGLLRLDCRKSWEKLRWHGVWGIDDALRETVRWYAGFYENGIVLSDEMLKKYIHDAAEKDLVWTK